jgi:hypothetical protein
VHAEPHLYKGDEKSTIIVIKYDDTYYATEFVKDISIESNGEGKSKKTNLGRSNSMKGAVKRCEERFEMRMNDGWTSPESVFGSIQEGAEAKKINSFLNKYAK